jgi:hypothetical protein
MTLLYVRAVRLGFNEFFLRRNDEYYANDTGD